MHLLLCNLHHPLGRQVDGELQRGQNTVHLTFLTGDRIGALEAGPPMQTRQVRN
jgi:hypothetical protein